MEVKILKSYSTWKEVKEMALYSKGLKLKTEPTTEWKRKCIISEHGILKEMAWKFEFKNVPSFVLVHLLRHLRGVSEPVIQSFRTDYDSVNFVADRNTPQNSIFPMNALALINISKKRMCMKASKETRELWGLVVKAIEEFDPSFKNLLQPSCVYRGFCPEFESCGFDKTDKYKESLKLYRKG